MDYTYVNKIKGVQLDINGLCNAGCWYCPVSYEGNPKFAINNMPINQIESVLKQLSEGKGDFVDNNLKIVWTAHYNEILLYKELPAVFDLYRKYGFLMPIASNGVALTKKMSDLIEKNIDIVSEVLLNIPSGNAETWASYVNMNKGLFKVVISNALYAKEKFGHKLEVTVNGLNEKSVLENGGWVEILDNAPSIDLSLENGTLEMERQSLQKLLPGVTVYAYNRLFDRAGHLERLNVIGQSKAIKKYLNKDGDKKVIGCAGGLEVRDRAVDWIHINANGDLFMCCDDFNFETIYDNINNKPLKDIWRSYNRQNMIDQARSTICVNCSAAIWG